MGPDSAERSGPAQGRRLAVFPARASRAVLHPPLLLLPLLLVLATACTAAGAGAAPSTATNLQDLQVPHGGSARTLLAKEPQWEVGGRLYDEGPQAVGAAGSSGASSGGRGAPAPHAPAQLQQRAAAGGGAQPPRRVPVGAVACMTFAMALASGLGAVPFLLFKTLSPPWAALANAVASGVMLAASFGLLHEGAPHGGVALVGGMLAGAAFVKLTQQYLERYEVDSFEDLRGADARRVILFLAVMAAHAVGEGSGVGVSFAGDRGWAAGTTVTLAILVHNVPEGLAVASVLRASGASAGRLVAWTTLTAMPQALVAVPAFLFVEAFAPLLPLAMGFAAGCMAWIVVAELLPDALAGLDHGTVASAATVAAACLQGLGVFIGYLESGPPPAQQAAPLPLLQLCVSLLLPCLTPGVAAGMAANLLPSRPAALGLSAGALAASGATALLWLVARSHQGLLATALLAATGAAAAAMLWREMGPAGADGVGAGSRAGSFSGAREADARKKRDGSPDAVNGFGAGQQHHHYYHHHHQQQQQQQYPFLHAQQQQHQHHRHPFTAADGAQLPSHTNGSSSHNGQQQHLHHSPLHHHQHHQQQLYGHHHLAVPVVGHALVSEGPGCPAGALPAAPPLGPTRSFGPDSLPMAHRLVRQSSSGPKGPSLSVLLTPGARLAAAGAAAAALSSAAHGVALGAALLRPGNSGGEGEGADAGRFVLPLALHGAIAGFACCGPLVLAVGGAVRRVGAAACGVCATGPALGLALAAVGPAAYAAAGGAAAASAAFDAAAEAVLAAAAGWGLHVGVALLLPQARAWHARRASVGAALGAAITSVGGAVLATLCVASPYCLHR